VLDLFFAAHSSRIIMQLPFSLCRGLALAFLSTLAFSAAAQDKQAAQDKPATQAQSALPAPLASFFDNSSFGTAVLSPSGRYLAAHTSAPGRRVMLAVVDLQATTAKIVAGYSDADIGHVVWVNDERLAFDVTENDVAPGDTFYGAGLYAVNRDGSRPIQLADRRGHAFVTEASSRAARELLPWNTFLMDQEGAQDSEWLYVTTPQFDNDDRQEPAGAAARAGG
jgi:hypothetical protein